MIDYEGPYPPLLWSMSMSISSPAHWPPNPGFFSPAGVQKKQSTSISLPHKLGNLLYNQHVCLSMEILFLIRRVNRKANKHKARDQKVGMTVYLSSHG